MQTPHLWVCKQVVGNWHSWPRIPAVVEYFTPSPMMPVSETVQGISCRWLGRGPSCIALLSPCCLSLRKNGGSPVGCWLGSRLQGKGSFQWEPPQAGGPGEMPLEASQRLPSVFEAEMNFKPGPSHITAHPLSHLQHHLTHLTQTHPWTN